MPQLMPRSEKESPRRRSGEDKRGRVTTAGEEEIEKPGQTLWKGLLGFSAVAIPVSIHTATKKGGELHFHWLHKPDNSPIRNVKFCREEDKEVPARQLVKGYEYKKGRYVLLTDEEIRKANVRRSKMIEISEFVKMAEIPTELYEKTYYLAPTNSGAAKAYTLIREAMKKTCDAGIARFAWHGREHVWAVMPHKDAIILNQLHYQEELVPPEKVKVPRVKFTQQELQMTENLLGAMETKFRPEKYHDPTDKELHKLIEKKARGKRIVVTGTVPQPMKSAREIIAGLKKSLAKEQRRQGRVKVTGGGGGSVRGAYLQARE